jgi:hypothetical protein
VDSDTTRIAFTEPGKPVLVTGKPGPDGNPEYRYVLAQVGARPGQAGQNG